MNRNCKGLVYTFKHCKSLKLQLFYTFWNRKLFKMHCKKGKKKSTLNKSLYFSIFCKGPISIQTSIFILSFYKNLQIWDWVILFFLFWLNRALNVLKRFLIFPNILLDSVQLWFWALFLESFLTILKLAILIKNKNYKKSIFE